VISAVTARIAANAREELIAERQLLPLREAAMVRVENPSDKGPHFRIFAGNVELGAAWQKTARDTERDYLSVSWTTRASRLRSTPP
jgi:uncharacterized protein (DUF736 family)